MTLQPLATSVHRAYTADLDAEDFYRMLRLRVDVFVVEQECPYPELDGRDLEATTRHFWIDSADGYVLGYLRLLEDPDGTFRIGRVCTAKSARGLGLARKLMRAAVAEVQREPAVLSAQTYALGFYRSFGFIEDGEEYLEDGIPHIEMRRDPRTRTANSPVGGAAG
ncbi:GNAT family N-acetyltransferase [Saccharopolyspora erythraea]|uniref:GCN5-related N-acetyltransferase n=1 Tax=Saccharopolyspora erythraea (strain ATCC 11635 / DSM 40517 / JCM 4748 / NBRC 13426 / NCIMB 8594 / NRRL 2338) TaxID=405948 RepID=A4FM73_SACEN|nr:GCN5 family N-acetyltransferase [Saccharopolyspora erythraea D]CAM05148.1 GCN5-related N-acetyltransferase [Saccharopolyspora erythraea NRRL 2338]